MPWVPRDLYNLMVDSLRQSRGLSVSGGGSDKPLTATASDHGALGRPIALESARPVEASGTVALSNAVLYACEQYAFGDRMELAANLAKASKLARQGTTDDKIVAAVRQGANVEALFVG